MKITVINGTEKHGVTYRMKEIFLEEFRKDAQITEYYLPKDCPGFCIGCTQCFREKEHLCKDEPLLGCSAGSGGRRCNSCSLESCFGNPEKHTSL